MRVCYVGQDGRKRITEIHRIKFLDDGFKRTDQRDEQVDELQGPVIIMHTVRAKGAAKRITLEVPPDFDIAANEQHILANGWLDLSGCTVKRENLY